MSATAPPPLYSHPCTPPWWARGGHAQTLWAHALPSPAEALSTHARAERHEIKLEDGDRLVVHALDGTTPLRVHLFHGLSGDADADYMRRTAAVLRGAGHGVWAANHRGCGSGRGLARGAYHSGSSGDIAAVLAASRKNAPQLAHVAVGFSLSGNALLLAAAEERVPWLAGLVAISPPVDLARCSRDLNRGLSRLYELRFTRRLARVIRQRYEDRLTTKRYDLPAFATMRQLEDLYTAPEAGFQDAAEYHARCSAGPRLADVRLPGVILTADDDPFVSPAPYDELALAPNLRLHREAHGGHTAFLERGDKSYGRWLDGALLHYVETLGGSIRASS